MLPERASRGRPRAFDREKALRAAQRLIWQHGFEAMSLSQLEHVMGIGKSSLYAAFGSKLELLKEAADLYLDEMASALNAVLDGAASTRAAMDGMLHLCANVFTDPSRPRGCFLVTTAPVCSEGNEQALALLKERRAVVTSLIMKRLEKGRRSGDLINLADDQALASYLMTIVHGMAIQARDGATREELASVGQLALSALDNVIVPHQ
jgi:AcrR family transcriptional regulator